MDKELMDKLQTLINSDPEARQIVEELVQKEAEPKGIGNKIKYLTKESGHKIKDLAEPMGVKNKMIVNEKLTKCRVPFQEFIRIVEYLGGSITVKVGDIEMQFTEEDL